MVSSGSPLSAIPSDDVRIEPDGRFLFRNVAPGSYQIIARGQTESQGVALFATYRVMVDGRDVEDLTLPLVPGGVVRGSLAFDGQTRSPRGFTGLRIKARSDDGATFGDALAAPVDADGRFTIRGVMAGRHHLTVEGVEAVRGFIGSSTRRFASATVAVTVTDGRLTVSQIGGTNTKLNYLQVIPLSLPAGS